MRRLVVSVALGAAIALPASFGVAAAIGEDNPSDGVPASQCPEAVAAMEQVGLDEPDYFAPQCPDPESIEPIITFSAQDIVYLDGECAGYMERYGQEPSWCPTDDEVTEAESQVGGQR